MPSGSRQEDLLCVPYINLWKTCESGAGHNWPKDHNFNKISRGLLYDATYSISRLKWFQTIFFHVSHFKKKASEYGQEIPQSHSADQPTAYVKHVNPDAGQCVAPWA